MNFKPLFKKIATLFLVTARRDLSIDLASTVSPQILSGSKGNKDFKIEIRNSIVTGNVTMREGCKISEVVCSGNIEMGRFVSLNGPATRISSRLNGIKIGSFSSIASNVVIQEDYHRVDKITTYFMNHNIFKSSFTKDLYSKGRIIIEEDVWVGSNSVILSGVKIGRGSIVGAGSVVTKDVPPYSIVGGNPAKVIKMRFDDLTIDKIEKSEWWKLPINLIGKHQDIFNSNLTHSLAGLSEITNHKKVN